MTTFLVDWILLPIKYSKWINSNYQYLLYAYNTFDEALKAIIRIIWRPGVFFVTNYDRNNSHSPKKTFRVDTVSDFVLVWGVNVTSWTQQYAGVSVVQGRRILKLVSFNVIAYNLHQVSRMGVSRLFITERFL